MTSKVKDQLEGKGPTWVRSLPPLPAKSRTSVVTIREFCFYLSVSRVTLWKWIRHGYVTAFRIGPIQVRIPRSEIARMREIRAEYASRGECPQYVPVSRSR